MKANCKDNVELVVADLDGTLLDPEHKLTPRTVKAVQCWVKSGGQFMLATGRHYQDVYLLARQLGTEMCLITSNGARVHNQSGELLYENSMPQNLVRRVLELSRGFDIHRNLYQQDLWLVEEPNEALQAIHDASGFRYTMSDFNEISLEQVDKIYFTAEHQTLLPLESLLKDELGDQLAITFTSPEYLEVMNFGISKGKALEMVLAKKGIDPQKVMALGDGMNDKEMLGLVGHCVVMANASDQLKALFPQAPIAESHAEDGVADYLERTVL